MILIGWGEKLIEDIWAGQYFCEKCGTYHNFYLKRINMVIRLFFIPIITFSIRWYIVGEGCETSKQLKRKEYVAMRKKQIEKLDRGEFPREIILKDCHPSKNKLALRFVLMILGVFVGGSTCLGVITAPIGLALIYFSIFNYVLASKKEKKYREISGN